MLIWPSSTVSNWLKLVNFSLAAMLRMLQSACLFVCFFPGYKLFERKVLFAFALEQTDGLQNAWCPNGRGQV